MCLWMNICGAAAEETTYMEVYVEKDWEKRHKQAVPFILSGYMVEDTTIVATTSIAFG